MGDLDCDQADEGQDGSRDQMSDDDTLNPDLELGLALDVEASIKILAEVRLLSLIGAVEVPLHPDQVSLWTFQLVDVCRGKVILVFS